WTEYEFDDALVSERGTSVKCTNCGHQFKVFRSQGGAEPEQWLIHTYDGREVVFHSLRDLKTAILGRQVLRSDRLTRGRGPSRTLGSIPELASFFDEAERSTRGTTSPRVPTPRGLGGPPSQMPLAPERMVARTLQGVAPAPHQVSVAMLPVEDSGVPPSVEPPTARKPNSTPPLPPSAPASPPIASFPGEASLRDLDPAVRLSRSEFPEDETAIGKPRNAGVLRWVLAVVVLGALGVVGFTFGQQLLGNPAPREAPSGASSGTVQELLRQGDRALAEGDLEAAQEVLIKASALADNDARVHIALSRLWATRADLGWLRLRLLPENAAEARSIAKRDLETGLERAKKSAARAAELAPEDVAGIRVKVDWLRLAEDRAVARALAPKLVATSTQPETAYVLAALDLGETSPPWPAIIQQLQLAASGETSPGRARAALVYALARSGDLAAARQELQRMKSAARPYPLVPELKEFLDGFAPAGAASAASSAAHAVDVGSLPTAPTPPSHGAGAAGPAVPVANAGDSRPDSRGDGEFSQEELDKARRRLFGDQRVDEKPKPEPPPENKPEPKPKPENKPHIDTSDLPGIQGP
ncbi:MAG: zinc-ribbon domain-containing protein, partial [Polyangiaceae bacterium]|nr:zinc-ribbon domain-containing protein [Polyangiaceae bacterium]